MQPVKTAGSGTQARNLSSACVCMAAGTDSTAHSFASEGTHQVAAATRPAGAAKLAGMLSTQLAQRAQPSPRSTLSMLRRTPAMQCSMLSMRQRTPRGALTRQPGPAPRRGCQSAQEPRGDKRGVCCRTGGTVRSHRLCCGRAGRRGRAAIAAAASPQPLLPRSSLSPPWSWGPRRRPECTPLRAGGQAQRPPSCGARRPSGGEAGRGVQHV